MKNEEKKPIKEPSMEDENIGKIRDILFGNNMSEIDKRFNSIEQELQEMITSIRDDMQKKLNSFDDFFKSEISALIDQLKKAQESRTASDDAIKNEIEKIKVSIEASNDDLKSNVRELRAKMMDHYKENSESISKIDRDLRKLTNKEVNQLTDSKVDRKSLAMLLSDVALKLSESNE